MEFEGSMRARGTGVQRLTLVLEHGRKSRTYLNLDFSSSERETEFILAIAREKLGRLSLSAPTLALTLRADALIPYAPRESTWLPDAKEQALDRNRLIERLSARLGSEKVFGIAIANDNRPELDWKKGTDPGLGDRPLGDAGYTQCLGVCPLNGVCPLGRGLSPKHGPPSC